MALLSVSNLEWSIGDRVLLDGVNLTLEDNEHVGIVGRNGTGKSSLMKLIANLGGLKPDSGQLQLARNVLIRKRHVAKKPEQRSRTLPSFTNEWIS